jgi:CRP/FNR family cyclic AMP-dependent transcriptional regulator
MRRVLYILAMLDDEDIDWLVSVGREEQVATGEAIITEGEPLEAIFIVAGGRFSVVVGRGNVIESLSAGEMLGEVSMLDSRPPTATVVASEPSTVLRIDRSAVLARLRANTGFAARFYKALAVFLAQRLRKTVATFGYGALHAEDSEPGQEDEIDPDLLDSLSLAGARFNMILERLRG